MPSEARFRVIQTIGGCSHNELTGDPHVTSCKQCGIFYPKVSYQFYCANLII